MQHLTDGCADTAVRSMHPGSAQHMGGQALDVGRWATSGRCSGARGTAQYLR